MPFAIKAISGNNKLKYHSPERFAAFSRNETHFYFHFTFPSTNIEHNPFTVFLALKKKKLLHYEIRNIFWELKTSYFRRQTIFKRLSLCLRKVWFCCIAKKCDIPFALKFSQSFTNRHKTNNFSPSSFSTSSF